MAGADRVRTTGRRTDDRYRAAVIDSASSDPAVPSPVVPDVAVVVTGHRESTLAHRTFRALARAVQVAVADGLAVEVVGMLDRADAATTAIFEEALGDQGAVGSVVPARVCAVSYGDPGSSRNHGVATTRAPWICVLDADNLPTSTWLRDAVRLARSHGGPCVVHPENLVIFEGRWEAWPQPASSHPGFRAENFFDRNYWDTFCLAAREVFEKHPYAATPARSGFGPEDWHWATETVQAGVAHLTAPDTALFYRVKRTGSVQAGHDTDRSLLPPSSLLVDPARAATALGPQPATGRRPRGLQRAILRHHRGRL